MAYCFKVLLLAQFTVPNCTHMYNYVPQLPNYVVALYSNNGVHVGGAAGVVDAATVAEDGAEDAEGVEGGAPTGEAPLGEEAPGEEAPGEVAPGEVAPGEVASAASGPTTTTGTCSKQGSLDLFNCFQRK